MSDEAVRAKTGRDWSEWFAVLDAAGAQSMSHSQIAAYLHEQQGVPGWWRQMVAVGYEQERGLREKHQRPDGYQVSASKTMPAPAATLYAAWVDDAERQRWLPDAQIVVRKATPNKTLRITWADDGTSVDVAFYAKGDDRTQITIQHGKLPHAEAGAEMKVYWSAALDTLKAYVEN